VIPTPVPAATHRLAGYACAARIDGLPAPVLHEAWRCLFNFVGCALGGGSHDVVTGTRRALGPLAGAGNASVIGERRRADPLFASLHNGAAASAHSFDDTHAQAIVHAGSPVGAAALAMGEHVGASGRELLVALALGTEATFRASKAASVAPAEGDLGWYQTGIAGGIGAAVAAGTLLRLDVPRMMNAIGLAVAQASGTRILQGSMAMLLLAGHAAQSGAKAALLAREGVGSPVDSLEGPQGFAQMYARRACVDHLVEGLGSRYELLANTYKAYPCGVVLHPLVDACLALHALGVNGADVAELRVHLHPAALALTDRPHPATRTAAQVSLQHWAAVALSRGTAELADGDDAALHDPGIRALRDRVQPVAETTFARDEVEVAVVTTAGEPVASGRFRGCAPLSDDALERKFRAQAAGLQAPAHTDALIAALRAIPGAPGLGAVSALL